MNDLDDMKTKIHRHFEEILNKGAVEVIPEVYSPDYVLHAPVGTGDTVGFAGLQQRVVEFRTGFPDIHFTVDNIIAEGEQIACRWILRGTHTGNFVGIEATGRTVEVPGIILIRFEDGKALEGWSGFDALNMMQQLGVM